MGKWAAALLIFVATSGTAGVRAADSPEEVLKKNGLKPMGPLYVLEAESDVKKKLSEVRLLSKQWNFARIQQESIGSATDHQALIQGLTGQVIRSGRRSPLLTNRWVAYPASAAALPTITSRRNMRSWRPIGMS